MKHIGDWWGRRSPWMIVKDHKDSMESDVPQKCNVCPRNSESVAKNEVVYYHDGDIGDNLLPNNLLAIWVIYVQHSIRVNENG